MPTLLSSNTNEINYKTVSAKLLRLHHEFVTIFVLSIMVLCRQTGYAQQAFVAAGGEATGAGGTASFSVGQVLDTAPTSVSGSVSQGVQQPYVNSVLPVTLTYFTAIAIKDRVELQWETAMERNNHFFSVERSKDAIHFSKIAHVEAAGNFAGSSKYSWTDNDPLMGTSYYRLKQTDFDLTSTDSRIRVVTISSLAGTFVYPNPAQDLLTVMDEMNRKDDRFYQIFDLNGRVVVDKKPLGTQKMIDLTQLLPAAYIIRVDNQSEVKEFKIIKK